MRKLEDPHLPGGQGRSQPAGRAGKIEDSAIALEKKLNRVAIIVSAIILLLVIFMRRVKLDIDIDFSFLPGVNALLNTTTSILLILAFYMIKKKRVESHMKLMTGAFITSFLFLLCYILYHFTTPETSFCKEGAVRTVYYFILITHIVLAGVSLPFILFTYIRAYTKQYERHKRLARKVYPVWLYVSISGPVVYLLLSPCY